MIFTMTPKNEEQKQSQKMVEIPFELMDKVEVTSTPIPGPLASALPSEILLGSNNQILSESGADTPPSVVSSVGVSQDKFWLSARFTVITLLIGFVPYMAAPGFLLPSFNHPMVRTVALALLVWNLIVAALFGNASTRGFKIFLFLVFALPLMTFGLWWIHSLYLFQAVGLAVN